jgi:D-arabinose 1-dehydrogenase-like Zn-dependent alcohol dehydrogenase
MIILASSVRNAASPLESPQIERYGPGPHDVQIDIAFCGVCHSDLRIGRSEWGGGIAETYDMLDFWAEKGPEKGIVAEIEMIPIQASDAAYERMQISDVTYRFVIDALAA